jgi:hypothetical protein
VHQAAERVAAELACLFLGDAGPIIGGEELGRLEQTVQLGAITYEPTDNKTREVRVPSRSW